MPAQIQINNIDASGGSIKVTGIIVLSGNYPTGGDTLNFATATADPTFIGLLASLISSSILNLDVYSMSGQQIAGSSSIAYDPVLTRAGTPLVCNPATGAKLKCSAVGTSQTTEHSAASYESQYTGDLTGFTAVFQKLL